MSGKQKVFITNLTAVVILFLGLVVACAQEPRPLRNDIKWMTRSIEYAAVCEQTYRWAWRVVKESAKSQTKNWAVVLDVDETVLDNSQYALERMAVNLGFTKESWSRWVFRKEASLIPGAKAFVDSVRTLGPGAHIAYITNRDYGHELATIENLKKYGLFKDRDTMLTRKSPEDTKELRRKCLEEGTGRCRKNGALVILALIGDNILDFIDVYGPEKAKAYRENVLPKDPNWGTKFFVLPNPNYGSWERDYQ